MAVLSQIEKKLADLHRNILRKDVNNCCSIILNSIVEAAQDNIRVECRGFGVFFSKTLKSRVGRNTKTGKTLFLKEGRKRLRFKPSKILLKRINKNFTDNKISDTY